MAREWQGPEGFGATERDLDGRELKKPGEALGCGCKSEGPALRGVSDSWSLEAEFPVLSCVSLAPFPCPGPSVG